MRRTATPKKDENEIKIMQLVNLVILKTNKTWITDHYNLNNSFWMK